MRSRFTRIPKVHDLIAAGVPTEAIPTYCALADHADNKSGLCWPRMETLARRPMMFGLCGELKEKRSLHSTSNEGG